ncbi:stage V sporulation protein AA [Aquibacillus sp. 3ASR75-11]|uniref:Stage V sporulation protein AA n=1 Tax=Terrihalobacillus insolitus TaxID=2950438 RepID=A0A9X3WVI2_9BACI|nr:stage V sporulation protein AA [Terrihalobacillus insolitus]MDC3413104.1 stage V sporulation protein AA [Terrihalobacillus insolitus]MDC3424846.1 stage V sporulation protein AA [Terrihalobacillus insolitus]
MGEIVYLRMKKKLEVKQGTNILLKDIAWISGSEQVLQSIRDQHIYQVKETDHNLAILDSFMLVDQLVKKFPSFEFQQLGPSETIIKIVKNSIKKPSIFLVSVIWLLLFIGAAMAIMNFHYDVSMQEVQQNLHYLLTGDKVTNPLWLQVPYSIGLGIGMILFFNHLFKKRFNEEPSPLEIEMHKYQQELDSYVTYHENELNKKDVIK